MAVNLKVIRTFQLLSSRVNAYGIFGTEVHIKLRDA
jgi:hypothetical protein